MRYFYRYLLITLSIFLILEGFLPQWLHVPYPRSLVPTFSKSIRYDYQGRMDEYKPQVLLLGNSILIDGMDEAEFKSITGFRTFNLAVVGAASAQYYLMIKNVISTDSTPPKYLLLFFLDNLLTTPDLWVNGFNFLIRIDEIAGENETVLLQKAYLNLINPVEGYLDSHFPIFGERQTLKNKIDNRLRYTLPLLFQKCAKPCLDKNLDMIFNNENMNPNPITPISIELDKWTGQKWDFNALIEKSFLPDIIQITKEKGINLILVREKNARIMNIEDENSDMRMYFQGLADYLKKEGIPLLDFSHDPVLTLDMFHDEMHLKPSARSTFTRLVAEGFLGLIQEK